MSSETSLAVLAISAASLIWIFRLVYRGWLHVGYGVIFGAGISAAALVAGLLPLVGFRAALGAHLPALIVCGAAFIVVMLVYTLSQLTRWSNRMTTLTQELAIRGADWATRNGTDQSIHN